MKPSKLDSNESQECVVFGSIGPNYVLKVLWNFFPLFNRSHIKINV